MTCPDCETCHKCGHRKLYHAAGSTPACAKMTRNYVSGASGPGFTTMTRCACDGFESPGDDLADNQPADITAVLKHLETVPGGAVTAAVAAAWQLFAVDLAAAHKAWLDATSVAHAVLYDRIAKAITAASPDSAEQAAGGGQ